MKRYLLLILSLVLVLGACTDDTEVEEETEEETTEAVGQEENSGEINMSLLATPNSLDPHAANDQPSNHVNVNIYERLVEFTPELELEPGLAESYEQIEDKKWKFNIMKDVKIGESEGMSTEAVKENLDRVTDEDVCPPVTVLFDLIEELEVIDEYTVHIKTESPFAALPSHLSNPSGGM